MNAIRTLIVDDEPLIRERVRDLVSKSDGLKLVGEAGNGLQALDLIAALQPDLVFIDVEMPELGGFGVLAEIEPDRMPAIIFITAFEQYARRAFDVGAVDYIYKPITPARFEAAVERARDRLAHASLKEWQAVIANAAAHERKHSTRKRFVVRKSNAHYFVPVEEIDWIDVADNYLRLHVGQKSHFARGTMKQAEDELDPNRFMRIHRSVMVAIDQISAIRGTDSGSQTIELKNGTQLRSSRQYISRVKELLR